MNPDLSPAMPSCLKAIAEIADGQPVMESSDGSAALVGLVKADDQKGVNAWVGKWFKDNADELYWTAIQRLRSSGLTERAEDAVHNAMVKVLDKLKDFEGRSSFKTWVTTILIRHCADLVGKEIREARMLELFGVWGEQIRNDGLVRDELVAQLDIAMGQLTTKEKTVVSLFYFDCLSETEVAAKMRGSIDSVSSIKHRTVKKLRKMLREAGCSLSANGN